MKTFTLNTKQLTLAAVAAACLACTAVDAQADAFADAAPARTVRYADLDLGTQAGAAALYQRIRITAEEVCGDFEYDHRRLDLTAQVQACIRKAIATSVHAVNDVRLTREYNSRFDDQQKTVNVASLR